MKKAILLVSLLCFFGLLKAQIRISAVIADELSHRPIPYVNVGIIDLSRGTVSDHAGRFWLHADTKEDMVSISSIGFKKMKLNADELVRIDTIYLQRERYELAAVTVVGDKLDKEVVLGTRNEKRGHSVGFGSTQLGTEIGSIIEVSEPTFIKTANFVLNHAKGDSLYLRLNFYDFSGEEVGEKLVRENVLVREKQRKGTISVDMKPYNLVLENDVLVTLEWLKNFNETGNKGITLDTQRSRRMSGVYIRYSSHGDFVKMPHKLSLKPCFYLEGIQ